jgi:hypothetical protein
LETTGKLLKGEALHMSYGGSTDITEIPVCQFNCMQRFSGSTVTARTGTLQSRDDKMQN